MPARGDLSDEGPQLVFFWRFLARIVSQIHIGTINTLSLRIAQLLVLFCFLSFPVYSLSYIHDQPLITDSLPTTDYSQTYTIFSTNESIDQPS